MKYILIMKASIRSKTAKQFSLILAKYHFSGKELQPEALESFGDLIDALVGEIMAFNTPTATSSERVAKVELLVEVVDRQQDDPTLNSLAKKLCLLFMLLRRMVHEGMMDELLEGVFHRHVTALLKQDIPRLTNQKQKRSSSSINKLYGFIRELSGSKQKHVPGRTNLQSETDKGALKEILSGIFQPFCCYLLRVLQSHESYHAVLRRGTGRVERSLQWAMVNSAKALGQIITQLHRFGRYFINDLLGVFLYLTLIVSKDVSLYYDALALEAERQATVWREMIEEEERGLQEGRGERRVFRMAEFKEMKTFIDELAAIREKIHYIIGNKYLKSYRCFFTKPAKYSMHVDNTAKLLEPLLDYQRKVSKWDHSLSRSLSNLQVAGESCLFALEAETISDQQTEELQYKLTTTMLPKPRMNNWLNKADRHRHARVPPILSDKEDIVSTNE